jgi:hypothetical protein
LAAGFGLVGCAVNGSLHSVRDAELLKSWQLRPDMIEFSDHFPIKGEFHAYDRRMLRSIQRRWYDLLDQRNLSNNITGRVCVEFQLHADGTVSDIKEVGNSADPLLALMCHKAIMDLSPFESWSEAMRRKAGSGQRELTLNFNYDPASSNHPSFFPRCEGPLAAFPEYEDPIAEQIICAWEVLLSGKKDVPTNGSVVLTFRLEADGQVTGTQITENTIGQPYGDLCLKAITNGAPYAPWLSMYVWWSAPIPA